MAAVKVISEVGGICAHGVALAIEPREKVRFARSSLFKLILRLFIFSIVFNGFSLARAGVYEDYWAAIRQDAPANLLRLVLGGFDPNTLDAEGNSGLTLALSESSFKVADVLLALDEVDVHTVNKAGWNALSLAAIRGNEGAVRRLIERRSQERPDALAPRCLGWARGGDATPARARQQSRRARASRQHALDAGRPLRQRQGGSVVAGGGRAASPEESTWKRRAGSSPITWQHRCCPDPRCRHPTHRDARPLAGAAAQCFYAHARAADGPDRQFQPSACSRAGGRACGPGYGPAHGAAHGPIDRSARDSVRASEGLFG